MEGTTTVAPRVIAEALHMDTLALAEVLATWALEAIPIVDWDGRRGPSSLENFDDSVAVARRYLANAHEAMSAWLEDNPEDDNA